MTTRLTGRSRGLLVIPYRRLLVWGWIGFGAAVVGGVACRVLVLVWGVWVLLMYDILLCECREAVVVWGWIVFWVGLVWVSCWWAA